MLNLISLWIQIFINLRSIESDYEPSFDPSPSPMGHSMSAAVACSCFWCPLCSYRRAQQQAVVQRLASCGAADARHSAAAALVSARRECDPAARRHDRSAHRVGRRARAGARGHCVLQAQRAAHVRAVPPTGTANVTVFCTFCEMRELNGPHLLS